MKDDIYAGMPTTITGPDHQVRYGLAADSGERANRLLWEHLTPAQREQYRKGSYFTAVGKTTGNHYDIHPHGVVRRDHERGRVGYCVVFSHEYCPLEDYMLMRKILIENDEKLFLATAAS